MDLHGSDVACSDNLLTQCICSSLSLALISPVELCWNTRCGSLMEHEVSGCEDHSDKKVEGDRIPDTCSTALRLRTLPLSEWLVDSETVSRDSLRLLTS